MYISEHEVRAVLTYEALIPAIRQALIDYSAGLVDQPPRSILRAGNAEGHRNGWFAVMPVIAGDVMAVKTVTFYPGNAELGLPTHMAVIELLRRSTGEPLAVMDGRLITEMRTAAVSAVAFAALAPLHFEAAPASLGILGSGVQAHAHIQALRQVWPALQPKTSASGAAPRPTPSGWPLKPAPAPSASRKPPRPMWCSPPPPLPIRCCKAAGLRRMRWCWPWAPLAPRLRELDDEAMLSQLRGGRVPLLAWSANRETCGSPAPRCRPKSANFSAGSGTAAIPRDKRIVFKSVGMAIEDLTAARLVWQARCGFSSQPE